MLDTLLSGRFADTLSPDVSTPIESDINPSLDSAEFSPPEPTTLHARHQPIGLGLGIDTGESTFANFLPMVEEVLDSPSRLPWGMEESTRSSAPAVTLSTRRVQLSPWPTSFENITPERAENQDSWVEGAFGLDTAHLDEENHAFSTLSEETNSDTPSEMSPSLSDKSPAQSSITPQTKVLETVDIPPISQRLTRRLLSFNRKTLYVNKDKMSLILPVIEFNLIFLGLETTWNRKRLHQSCKLSHRLSFPLSSKHSH
jgi:hypothetical protein